MTPHFRLVLSALAGGIIVAACAAQPARADSWTGPDKAKHFAVSAGLGLAAAELARRDVLPCKGELCAVAAATLPGLLKELSDSRAGGSGFSYKDMVFNLAGAYVGVKLYGVFVSRQNGTTHLTYRKEF